MKEGIQLPSTLSNQKQNEITLMRGHTVCEQAYPLGMSSCRNLPLLKALVFMCDKYCICLGENIAETEWSKSVVCSYDPVKIMIVSCVILVHSHRSLISTSCLLDVFYVVILS